MLSKIIITSFVKGFGNSFNLVLPYRIKNPYGDIHNILNKDWKIISSDIYRIINKKKGNNV